MPTDAFVQLVWKAADGRIPNNRAAFVQFLLDYFCRPENLPVEVRDKISLREGEEVRRNFAMGLACAVDCVAREGRRNHGVQGKYPNRHPPTK